MSGERMHKARHSAGQTMLDATGNLKAVQRDPCQPSSSGGGGNRTRALFPTVPTGLQDRSRTRVRYSGL
jgi:hypothetical protein